MPTGRGFGKPPAIEARCKSDPGMLITLDPSSNSALPYCGYYQYDEDETSLGGYTIPTCDSTRGSYIIFLTSTGGSTSTTESSSESSSATSKSSSASSTESGSATGTELPSETSSTATATAEPSSGTPIGAIVGGVVGGIGTCFNPNYCPPFPPKIND